MSGWWPWFSPPPPTSPAPPKPKPKPKPPPPPASPPPSFKEPWRKIQWGDKEKELQFVKDYKPHAESVEQLRFMLHGPVGSGKSSFINSMDSMLQGRMSTRAHADTTCGSTFTLQYTTYKIQKGSPKTFYPFSFTDIMGLEKETNKGVHVEDIKLGMKGQVQENYTFNPSSALTEDKQEYKKSPSLKEKCHVLVCVVDANKINLLSDEYVKKLRDVRLTGRDLKVPQIVILTHIDEVCPEIQRDIKNVYKSRILKEKMEKLSASLGIPLNCIFPVKNYHSEIDPDDDIDTLLLSALRHMIYFGEDFVNSMKLQQQYGCSLL